MMSKLQLSQGTVVVLDETKLEPGQVRSLGFARLFFNYEDSSPVRSTNSSKFIVVFHVSSLCCCRVFRCGHFMVAFYFVVAVNTYR